MKTDKIAENIEQAFQEGIRQFEIDDQNGSVVGNQSLNTCPYSRRRKLERHWWTRGYSYQARLFRAIKAEMKLDQKA